MTTNDLKAIEDEWLQQCGPCDAGLPMGCACSQADPRHVISGLVSEIESLRRGGEELGKSLVFWLELAKDVTCSDDAIEDDGDGDWGVVAERLAALKPKGI